MATLDYSDVWANRYHVMLEGEELATVQWEQVLERGRALQQKLVATPGILREWL